MGQQNNKENKRWLKYLIFLFPTMFIIIGIPFCIRPVKLFFTGDRIAGTVVGVRSHESKNDEGNVQTLYSPIIEYTCGGQTITQSPGYSSSKQYVKNQKITVLCDKSNPTEFATYGDFFALIFPLMGLIFLLIQIYNFKSAQKKDNLPDNLPPETTGGDGIESGILSQKASGIKTFLSKDISEIKSLKKASINIDQTLSTAIIFLILSILFGFLLYSTTKSDNVNVSGIIFFSIFIIVLGYSCIVKFGEYFRSIIAKSKIKKGNMAIIQARVAGFQHTADVLDKKYYKIICNDGKSIFYSKEIMGKTYGYDDYPLKYLHTLNIIYDTENPQKTLYELDNHPKKMMLTDGYQVTSDRLAKQIAGGEDYEHPYGIFNDKKISVGDTINVYVDPNNNKSYLVDLLFLE